MVVEDPHNFPSAMVRLGGLLNKAGIWRQQSQGVLHLCGCDTLGGGGRRDGEDSYMLTPTLNVRWQKVRSAPSDSEDATITVNSRSKTREVPHLSLWDKYNSAYRVGLSALVGDFLPVPPHLSLKVGGHMRAVEGWKRMQEGIINHRIVPAKMQ